jgi:hypothetical protein
MVQEKLHILFFYKSNKYLLEKKFSASSSFDPIKPARMSTGQTKRNHFRNPDRVFPKFRQLFLVENIIYLALFFGLFGHNTYKQRVHYEK